LRDIYPLILSPPTNYIRLLGKLSPITLTCIGTRPNASCGIVRGPFPPATAMVRQLLCMFCGVPEHEPLLSGGTTPYWVSPESSRLEQDESCFALMLRRREEREKKRNGKQTSSPSWGSKYLRKRREVLYAPVVLSLCPKTYSMVENKICRYVPCSKKK